jgi:hypothetical protein
MDQSYYLGIDMGAGSGAKIGLFSSIDKQEDENFLSRKEYGESPEQLTEALTEKIESILKNNQLQSRNLRSIGIASPGIFKNDGTWLLPSNLVFLKGYNLRESLENSFNIPVAIENDADAGGLAEWSVMRTELLYWVFGGGWGGSWISNEGEILYPATDWDGKDNTLHYTNEPGYAVPLDTDILKTLFYSVESSFSRFREILCEDLKIDENSLSGPNGNKKTIRSEYILSGPGRCRLFRSIVGDDNFYERFLNINETDQMSDPAVAGQHISKLSSMRVEAAVKTDRLFGKCLALATQTMMNQALKDGASNAIPICLGGKPSYALPYFGPSTQRAIGAMGIMSYMRPSIIDERGGNANLTGAAVLAEKAYYKSK